MKPSLPDAATAIPLVVDVDGTLLRTDLLHEAALNFIARSPLQGWRLAIWLLRGKAALKARLAGQGDPGTDRMPLREEVVALIREAQAEGRPVYLASASDRRWVEPIAARIGGLTGVFASDGQTNLAGRAKAAALEEAFGAGGFDYVGDAKVDFPVWQSARHRLLVAHSGRFETAVRRAYPDAVTVARPRIDIRARIRTLRPHQWAKNALVFLPLLLGHSFLDPDAVLGAVLGFMAFCLAASSAYIINDLLDLAGDRDHPRKCRRPLASGDLSITHGLAMAALLMIGAVLLATLLPVQFGVVLGSYVVLTLAYSLILKRRLLIDVVVLGGLYTLRVFGGVTAAAQVQSPWLLMFSLFLFLSLAIVKRCAELVARREAGKSRPPGRGYRSEDLAVLFPLGAASGFCAALVVAQYLSSPEVSALYAHPKRLWLICPLLIYWVSRMLVISGRNELHDDPLIFALTDKISWLVTGMAAIVVLVAI